MTLLEGWQRFASRVLVEFDDGEFERRLARSAFYHGATAALRVIADDDESHRAAILKLCDEIDTETRRRAQESAQ